MAYDRFLITPVNNPYLNDLKTFACNASFGYNYIKNERCIVKLRKDTIDLSGKVFGNLTAVNPIKTAGRRGLYWGCKCSCGNKIIVYGSHLRAGYRISCGCIARKDIKINAVKKIFDSYKRKAKKRKIEFKLELDEFKNLALSNCYFCGSEPKQEVKSQKTKEVFLFHNGIDRMDSEMGYLAENCVSCCKYCNYAKSDMTFDQFKIHIKRINEWLTTNF